MKIQFILTFIFIIIFQSLQARHIVGGELSYACLGNNQFRFDMSAYRDCFSGGALFDSFGNNSLIATVTVFENNSIISTIDLDAPTISSFDFSESLHPCPERLDLCLERGDYQFIQTLPATDKRYTITYQRCCRSSSISNILNPSSTGMTFTVDISPESQSVCNSSPIFSSPPIPLLCINEAFNINISAVDNDEDELRYSFYNPLLGGGTAGSDANGGSVFALDGVVPNPDAGHPYLPIQFQSPTFSYTNPFGGNPNVTIDSITGIITGTTAIIGQFVYGVCVKEYRNGILLSTVRRDFQLNVADCDTTSTPCGSVATIEQNLNNTYLKLTPNPTSGELFLSLSEYKISSVKVFDLNGSLLFEKQQDLSNIDISYLQAGVYFLQVQDDKGNQYNKKVVKI